MHWTFLSPISGTWENIICNGNKDRIEGKAQLVEEILGLSISAALIRTLRFVEINIYS